MADKLHTSDSAVAQQRSEDECLEKTSCRPTKEANTVKPLSLLAGAALAPSSGKEIKYSCTCDACCCREATEMDLHAANLQLQFFISRADNIHKSLIEGVPDGESLVASLLSFLFTCRPYFNNLQSSVRSILNKKSPLSESTCSQLLDFSETLVNKLENLVLTFTSNELLSLDETEPNSVSHFHIGQFGIGPMRVTIFRYCQPTPYLGQVNTGLYKRMRWNVDRMEDATQQLQIEVQLEIHNTEYYFLCFEDINALPEGDNQSMSYGSVVRVWSIGQWIQISPETNDINDWVLCRIPQGTYLKRVILGSEEPSCHFATECLQQLLMLDLKNSSQ